MSLSVPIGNIDLLTHERKTTFLSSRNAPANAEQEVKKWVETLDPATDCVLCGNLQQIERKALAMLLARRVPTVLVLDEPYPALWPTNLVEAIGEARLLVITTTDFLLPWVDRYGQAESRNRYMISNASKIVLAHLRQGGQLHAQLAQCDSPIQILTTVAKDNGQLTVNN